MRLRNIKGAQDIIAVSDYVINIEKYKNKPIFNNSNKIEIEIGMGKGDFIIEKAKQNPHINFIGIEKYATVLVSVVKKLEKEKLDNLKIINLDASNITDFFSKNISKIYLNFSDPWPKKKHANRRLTSKIFLDKYAKIFKDDYIIEMKTDNQKLFEYSLQTLSQNGYYFDLVSLDLYANLNEDNIATEYEKKFVKLGNKIYKLIAIHKVDEKIKN